MGSSPADHDEQHRARYQHNLYQCEPLFYKHISHRNYPFQNNSPKAGSPLGRSFLLRAGGLSGRMLPFHYHRYCTHVSFAAVLGINVFQHGLSRQSSWISKHSMKALDPLCVCAGTTDENRTSVMSSDAVHNRRVQQLFRCSM